jgi:hypothetical protein
MLIAIVIIVSGWSMTAWSDEPEYLALFMEGKKVGYAINTRTVADDKVTTVEDISIIIRRICVPVTIKMSETSTETKDGKPLSFESVQLLGAMTIKVMGTVDKQGTVSLTSMAMGAEQKSTFQWTQGAVMAEGLRLFSLKQEQKEGTQYTAKIFSPSLMQVIDANISVGAEQNVDLLGRVVRLREETTIMTVPGAGEVVTKNYVDNEQRVLKSTVPIAGMQVEMVACAKEFALGENDVLEIIEKMFVKSPQSLDDVGSAGSITYTLTPDKDAKLIVPATDSQKAERSDDGKMVVTVTPISGPTGAKFPYKGKDEKLIGATKPTRFLQSDQKEVIELARRAVGDTKDATEAVRRIEAFVARYVENKSLSVGYATAAEVAVSRQGDCSEFAVLTAAMCRAVGIPAQVVVGIAYIKNFGGIEGFGGHAWAQAYISGDETSGQQGKWVSLDAAFKSAGLGGFDAGHIALAMGDGEPGDFFNMAAMLGKFKIEKVTLNKRANQR